MLKNNTKNYQRVYTNVFDRQFKSKEMKNINIRARTKKENLGYRDLDSSRSRFSY